MRRSLGRECPVVTSVIKDSMDSYLEELESKPGANDLRIYFQNVGTLVLGEQVGETNTALKALGAADVSLICLGEINKNLEHPRVREKVRASITLTIPGAQMQYGTNEGYDSLGRQNPGGLLTIMRKSMKKYVVGKESDKKGRWTKTILDIGKKMIAVYNIYVPLKQDGGGSTTVRRQLQNSLDEEGVQMTLMRHFYKELEEEIRDEKTKGSQIVIGGDFNETVEEKGEMTNLFERLSLVNLFREKWRKCQQRERQGGGQ